MLTRAYSVVQIKAVDDEQRIITGIASTPETDRAGDIVESKGASFKNPLPLLLHHDARLPVGKTTLRASQDGIAFVASLPNIDAPGKLKDRIDEAWQSLKSGLLQGVSIGFRAKDDGVELLKTGGLRFTDFEILELSLVAIPANASATIQTIKSLDAEHLAAIGDEHASPAGASAIRRAIPLRKDSRQKVQTYSEQISALEAKRAASVARMDEISQKALGENRTKDETEKSEFDDLKAEVKGIDSELVDLREMEALNVQRAVPAQGTNPQVAAQSRAGSPVYRVAENTPPGIGMARVVIAKMKSYMEQRKGNFVSAAKVAKNFYPNDARVQEYFTKADVAAGNTTDTNWAEALVEPTTLSRDFIDYLRARTLVGRIPFRSAPFNVRIPRQTTGGTGYWVGEGEAKPVTKFNFDAVTLPYTKVANIAVITQELARFSNPSAEAVVRDQLAAACQERLDTDLIDPAKAVSSGVNPASLTNGLTALSSAGTSADNIRTDVMNLLEPFLIANYDVSGLVLVMPNTLALAASLLVTSNGVKQFPDLTMNGGSLQGIPVFTSMYAASGASFGNMVIAIDTNSVALADDGNFTVDVSTEASLQMLDNPTNSSDTPTPTTSVSLWQTNSIGIRCERFIHWVKLRSGAVVYMDDVNWGAIGSPY